VEDDLFFQLDGSRFRLYDPAADPPPVLAVAPPSGSTAPVEALEPEGTIEFAYGRDLRDFLVKNLSLLEVGLHLYEDEGITGIEFPAGGRFIDILAVDAQGRYVVLELKVSRGYDRVVGQLLRYMAWVKQHQAEETQQVRGIISDHAEKLDENNGLLLAPHVDYLFDKGWISFAEHGAILCADEGIKRLMK
jgi:endonuclease